jgi:hypothetical protein
MRLHVGTRLKRNEIALAGRTVLVVEHKAVQLALWLNHVSVKGRQTVWVREICFLEMMT